MIALQRLFVGHNSLRGHVPEALGSMLDLRVVSASQASLSGAIPPALTGKAGLVSFVASDNQLSGSLPSGFSLLYVVCVHGNRLTGTLPFFIKVNFLTASGNLFEGGLRLDCPLPERFSPSLACT